MMLNTSNMYQLTFKADDETVDLGTEASADIHNISCVLKNYFRSLPDPLFISDLVNEWISAASKIYHSFKESRD